MRSKFPVIFGFGLVALAVAFPEELGIDVNREIERIGKSANAIDTENVVSRSVPSMCSTNPEEEMTTIDMIRSRGYKAEEHFVKSDDGYILALHRIPGPKGSTPVLMHHALLESSFCWVITGKGKGLAFLLADAGYDVWMANARGNTYSRNHTSKFKSPNNSKFWNFSWHEMGVYDIPAEIDYISSINDKGLLYIGYSMGTTMFFVMASERLEYGAKVKAMFGLAPVAFTNHIQGPFQALGNILRYLEVNADHQGMYEFFNQSPYSRFAVKCICNQPILSEICDGVVQAIVGFNFKQSNLAMLPLILTHTPAGTSMKTIMHFKQGIQTGKFRHYDYGRRNMQHYNSSQPLEYDFTKIQTPIALFWGQNDFLAQPQDVRRLYNNLPKKVEMYQIRDPHFNHLDFLWVVNAPNLVYSRLMALMDKYRSSNETQFQTLDKKKI